MKMERNSLTVTPWEARRLANRLRGVAPLGFVPDDPDEETDPNDPDLLMCAASYLENGGTISVKGRDRAPVQPQEPPVETEHNPPHTLEPQAGNPMEPGRAKVRPEHPDVGLTADGPGDPDEEDDDGDKEDGDLQGKEQRSGRRRPGAAAQGSGSARTSDRGDRQEQGSVRAHGLQEGSGEKQEKGRIGTPPTHRPAKVEEVDNPLETQRQIDAQRQRKK